MSLLAASKTLVTAFAERIDPRDGPARRVKYRRVGISQRVNRRDRPTCRVEYRRRDKPECVRRRDRPACSVESKTRPVPKRIHASRRGYSRRHILLCCDSNRVDACDPPARGVIDRRRGVPQRVDVRHRAIREVENRRGPVVKGIDRRDPAAAESNTVELVFPRGSMDATGLLAASKTVVETVVDQRNRCEFAAG